MTNPHIDLVGAQEWYANRKLHRIDGPAIIYGDGTRAWYVKGKRHRIDGPAVIRGNGTQMWYVKDKRHRTDGPAVIYSDGTRSWYVNGQRHYLINSYKEASGISAQDMTLLVLKYGNIT